MPSFFGRVIDALGGLQLAGENLHQGGFAGAVGAGDGVAPARDEGAGHVLEEDPRTEAHSDIVHGQHNPPSIADDAKFAMREAIRVDTAGYRFG